MLVATVGISDLVVIYLVPVVAVVACWNLAAIFVYLVARFSRTSRLRQDLEQRVAAKQLLPSGKKLRLSYGYVALALAADNCVQATALYRLGRWLVEHRLGRLALFTQALGKLVAHIDISPYAEIGPGLFLYHGLGTVVGKGTRIGSRAVICQNVTLGGGPVLGDDVKVWSGAQVIGRVSIGDRSEIGANGVAIKDVPDDVVAVGVPATRFLPKGRVRLVDAAEIESGRTVALFPEDRTNRLG